jgi:hypothetical protein
MAVGPIGFRQCLNVCFDQYQLAYLVCLQSCSCTCLALNAEDIAPDDSSRSESSSKTWIIVGVLAVVGGLVGFLVYLIRNLTSLNII